MSKGLRILLALTLAAAVGCQAGSTFHGWVEMGQWTPTMETGAGTAGGSGTINMVSTGGLDDGDSFWTYDVGLRFTKAANNQLGAYAFNIGYFDHEYAGKPGGTVTNHDFGGVTLNGTLQSKAEFSLLKFTYEEPSSGTGGERTGGLIGIHNLGYNITTSDGTNTGRMEGTAPMFVIGYKIAYFSQNLMYFFNVEWMDLDTITLSNVKGDVLDSAGGVRWVFDDSGNMAITLGYRLYDASLDIKDDALSFVQDGAYFSFFFAW